MKITIYQIQKPTKMAELILMLKDVLTFGNQNRVVIDSWEFKTSSQFTPALLVLSSTIVTVRQFFGEPIQCDPGQVLRPQIYENLSCKLSLQREILCIVSIIVSLIKKLLF